MQAQSIEGLHNWIEAIRTFPKPVIAAVEGAAAGAGFSLVLVVTTWWWPRDSIFVMAYSSVRLVTRWRWQLGLSRACRALVAAELMLLGERIGAQRLHAMGLGQPSCSLPRRSLQPSLGLGRAHSMQRAPNALASIKELLINDASGNSKTCLPICRKRRSTL